MDLSKLATTLLSSDSVKGLSKATGTSNKDVKSVLTAALPSLLEGASSQAKGKSTSKGFAGALTDHAKADTSDLASFLGNVDLKDGSKIITHLLGSDKSSITKSVSKSTGVSSAKTNDVLSAVGPLLMSLMGQQAEEEEETKSSGLEAVVGSLLDNVDLGSLLTGVLTDSSSKKSSTKTTAKKSTSKSTKSTTKKTSSKSTTKKTSSKSTKKAEEESSSQSALGGILGGVLKNLFK